MTATQLVEEVHAVGGTLWINGDKLGYRLPPGSGCLVAELRQQKEAVICHLRMLIPLVEYVPAGLLAGHNRIAARTLPNCPACGSFALYRLPAGGVECQTCGAVQ